MSVVCPECKSEAERLYPDALEMNTDTIEDTILQFNILKMYQCTKCNHVFELSQLEIIKIFSKVKGGIDFNELRTILKKGKDKLLKGDFKNE